MFTKSFSSPRFTKSYNLNHFPAQDLVKNAGCEHDWFIQVVFGKRINRKRIK